MKKQNKSITNPDELNKNLQYSSPITWIVLSSVVLLLVAFFAWSAIYKIKIKLTGTANISNGAVTLQIDESKLSKLKEGQKVYISGLEGQILSFNDNQPVVSSFALDDGEYDYYIVIKEARPIDFLLNK
ncbi:MAG: hypothetical protein J6T25_04135 [Bacilli bacterium]|nr:hypothetical protein [Bacilli bacterium]